MMNHRYVSQSNPAQEYSSINNTNSNGGSAISPAPTGMNAFFMNMRRNNSNNCATVSEPTKNDILCGKGSRKYYNAHAGNIQFRNIIRKHYNDYYASSISRKEKAQIASGIVQHIRSLDPPGRFLDKDSKTGLLYDIGDTKAMKKVTQALRKESSGNNNPVPDSKTAASSSEFLFGRGSTKSFKSTDAKVEVYNETSEEFKLGLQFEDFPVGRPYPFHPKIKLLNSLVEEHVSEYVLADKIAKRTLANGRELRSRHEIINSVIQRLMGRSNSASSGTCTDGNRKVSKGNTVPNSNGTEEKSSKNLMKRVCRFKKKSKDGTWTVDKNYSESKLRTRIINAFNNMRDKVKIKEETGDIDLDVDMTTAGQYNYDPKDFPTYPNTDESNGSSRRTFIFADDEEITPEDRATVTMLSNMDTTMDDIPTIVEHPQQQTEETHLTDSVTPSQMCMTSMATNTTPEAMLQPNLKEQEEERKLRVAAASIGISPDLATLLLQTQRKQSQEQQQLMNLNNNNSMMECDNMTLNNNNNHGNNDTHQQIAAAMHTLSMSLQYTNNFSTPRDETNRHNVNEMSKFMEKSATIVTDCPAVVPTSDPSVLVEQQNNLYPQPQPQQEQQQQQQQRRRSSVGRRKSGRSIFSIFGRRKSGHSTHSIFGRRKSGRSILSIFTRGSAKSLISNLGNNTPNANNDNNVDRAQQQNARRNSEGRRSYRRSSSITTLSGERETMEVEFGKSFRPTAGRGDDCSLSDLSGLSMSTISGLFSRRSRASAEVLRGCDGSKMSRRKRIQQQKTKERVDDLVKEAAAFFSSNTTSNNNNNNMLTSRTKRRNSSYRRSSGRRSGCSSGGGRRAFRRRFCIRSSFGKK